MIGKRHETVNTQDGKRVLITIYKKGDEVNCIKCNGPLAYYEHTICIKCISDEHGDRVDIDVLKSVMKARKAQSDMWMSHKPDSIRSHGKILKKYQSEVK